MSMIAALLLAAASAPFPVAKGSCRWVRARFSDGSNGSSVRRFWAIGTHHMLALYDDVPAPALDRLYRDPNIKSGGAVAFGEFRLCALERYRRGNLQHVRATGIRKIIVVPR